MNWAAIRLCRDYPSLVARAAGLSAERQGGAARLGARFRGPGSLFRVPIVLRNMVDDWKANWSTAHGSIVTGFTKGPLMTPAFAEIAQAISKHAPQLEKLAKDIHAAPELGFQETRACKWMGQLLRKQGFRVKTPYAKLPTAFKAVIGRGGPTLCFMAEYDALPGIGHACGHNLIAAAAAGAGLALSAALKQSKTPGTVVVMGTPAEESAGGKVIMLRNGALKGIDAVMMAHPSWRTTRASGGTAIHRLDVAFKGLSAHAAACPEKAKNALDAVMLLFAGVNAWRQQLPESGRVHGIVTEGGVKPNIIPDLGACSFFLRSPDADVLAGMLDRFRDIVKGAALMTAARATVTEGDLPYKAQMSNPLFNAAYVEEAGALGLRPQTPDAPVRGSSDFGDVSQAVPGAHVFFGIARKQIPSHSIVFAKAAGSAYGRKQMLRAAQAMARVGWRYFRDPAFRKSVHDAFDAQKAGKEKL